MNINQFEAIVGHVNGTINVKASPYLAKGDNVSNDTAAIQAAINAVGAAGGGIVFIPQGRYHIEPPTISANAACLTITYDNVTLQGEGDVTELIYYNRGGGDPSTTWDLLSGEVQRGHGISILGGSTQETTRKNVKLYNFKLNGNSTFTGNTNFPANTTTGDGWDLTHKAIYIQADTWHDNHTIERCHIHNWRGEIVYGGGSAIGKVTIEDCLLHDTNADATSITGGLIIIDNEAYNCAHAAIENAYGDARNYYARNYFHHCKQGMSLSAINNPTWGQVIVENNFIDQCDGNGIELLNCRNVIVRHNVVQDCSLTGGTRSIKVENVGGTFGSPNESNDIQVSSNTILANRRNVQESLAVSVPSGTMKNIRVVDNYIGVTKAGLTSGYTVNVGVDITGVGITNLVNKNNLQSEGVNYSPNFPNSVSNKLITSTSAQTLINIRPNGGITNYVMHCFYRVVSTCNVQIILEYVDPAGNTLDIDIVNVTGKTAGNYPVASYFFNADGSNDGRRIKLMVVASVANAVYVSGVLEEKSI